MPRVNAAHFSSFCLRRVSIAVRNLYGLMCAVGFGLDTATAYLRVLFGARACVDPLLLMYAGEFWCLVLAWSPILLLVNLRIF